MKKALVIVTVLLVLASCEWFDFGPDFVGTWAYTIEEDGSSDRQTITFTKDDFLVDYARSLAGSDFVSILQVRGSLEVVDDDTLKITAEEQREIDLDSVMGDWVAYEGDDPIREIDYTLDGSTLTATIFGLTGPYTKQ